MAPPFASLRDRFGTGPLVLAAALPFLFLHRHYQPTFSAGRVDADLSDFAVLAVVVAAVASGELSRLRVSRGSLAAWLALALLVLAGTAWGAARYGAYPAGTHLVTAAKWIEYMLLAPALVLIARRPRDLVPAAVAGVAWSCCATAVGLLQFLGALGDLDNTPAGRRKPSFLGYHDFAALSAVSLLLALLVVARGARTRAERRVAQAAGVSGGVGLVLGGAFDTLLGLVLAAAALVVCLGLRDGRRLTAFAGILAAVTLGIVLIRGSAIADGLKYLGIKQGTGGASAHVQSYRQRVLLAYIGGRIFLAHPLLGAGWEGSSDEYAYGPFLADARSRFTQPPEAFPSPAHPWGVQNAYVQSLADLGALGLPAFLAALLVPAWLAFRRGAGDSRAVGVALSLVVLGVWNGYGLTAGIPLDALTWLGGGVAAASVAFARTAA